jgi:hypothetical protein
MLIDDAKVIFKRAWSVRLALLSAVFSVLEVGLPFFTDLLPPGALASLAMLSAVGSAIMRIVYQPAMHTGEST